MQSVLMLKLETSGFFFSNADSVRGRLYDQETGLFLLLLLLLI